MKDTKHFKASEFDCKDGCGQNEMDKSFIYMLEQARDLAGIPFWINSGFRCPDHNKAVGGKEDSAHLKGLAADIDCNGSYIRLVILRSLLIVGFSRIGIGKNFIHVDLDIEKPRKVIWLY